MQKQYTKATSRKDIEDLGMFHVHTCETFTKGLMERGKNVVNTVHQGLPSKRFAGRNQQMTLQINVTTS